MSQEQRSTISGSIWDVYTTESQGYKQNTMPRVGQIACFEDGRRYVFCSTEADLAEGTMVGKGPGTAIAVAADSDAPAGQNVIKLVVSDVVGNAMAGGHLALEGFPGTYKVKGNTVVVGVGVTTVTLYDPLVQLVPSGTVAMVTRLRPRLVIPCAVDGDAVGVVAQDVLAQTSGLRSFFWAQTSGHARLAGVAIASSLAFMQAAAGAVVAADGTKQALGRSIRILGADTIAELFINQTT